MTALGWLVTIVFGLTVTPAIWLIVVAVTMGWYRGDVISAAREVLDLPNEKRKQDEAINSGELEHAPCEHVWSDWETFSERTDPEPEVVKRRDCIACNDTQLKTVTLSSE